MTPGSTAAGQNSPGSRKPPMWMSQAGVMRTAPSSQPVYQSGCAKLVESQGW